MVEIVSEMLKDVMLDEKMRRLRALGMVFILS